MDRIIVVWAKLSAAAAAPGPNSTRGEAAVLRRDSTPYPSRTASYPSSFTASTIACSVACAGS